MGKKAVTPNSEAIRGNQRQSEAIRGNQYRGQEGGHAKLDEPTRAEAQPGLEPRLGHAKVRAEAAVELRHGGATRRGAAGRAAARVRAQSLAAGTWESAGWSVREHLEVDEPRGENAALAVNSRVSGATLPEELLRIGDRAVPHPQILAFAQLVADEQPAVDIAGDGAARRGCLRGFRLSAVLHKERVHVLRPVAAASAQTCPSFVANVRFPLKSKLKANT